MRLKLLPLAAVCLAAAPLTAQDAATLGARIDSIFGQFTRATPGCAVGLAKDGRTLYTHGYGSANLEYDVPLTDSTVLESGSIAKQFTASALALLALDGRLSLDDDVRKYLPEVPEFGGQRITIRNLLTHTSGLRDQWGLLGIEGRGPGTQIHTPLTTLDLIEHQKTLNFPPGSHYLYSNTGYALAGLIVQRVSGKSLAEFTRERLFEPLGMHHTEWRADFTKIVVNRATAYTGTAATGFHTDMPFTDMIGNGGLLSTMSDLLRWNENLDHPTVGGEAYVRMMETPMRLTSGRTITYALGLQFADYDGVREIGHGGSTAGYRTYMARYPDQHVIVVVWCNGTETHPDRLAHGVATLVLTKPPRVATQATVATFTPRPEQLARWAGVYRDEFTDETMALATSPASLTTTGRAPIAFTPVDTTRFRTPQGEASFSGAAGHRRFVLARANGDTSIYEEVLPAPEAISPSDYVGTYNSDELDVKLVVAARDGRLVLRRRPADEVELRPAYADDFVTQSFADTIGHATFRFARDARGKVTGFSIYAGRVLDVRFSRAEGGAR